MTDIDDDGILKPSFLHRCRAIAWPTIVFASPAVSLACALTVFYFTYTAVNRTPPADVSLLAVSILKSNDASPEMKSWATKALGIYTEIPK